MDPPERAGGGHDLRQPAAQPGAVRLPCAAAALRCSTEDPPPRALCSFTGYSGPSARRIWSAIYNENCFTSEAAGAEEVGQCLEERVFSRLLSGLQARRRAAAQSRVRALTAPRRVCAQTSINTHLTKDFYFPDRCGARVPGACAGCGAVAAAPARAHAASRARSGWGPNVAMYVERVGAHPERIRNLYLLYLFVVRAVAKARVRVAARVRL